MKIYGVQAPSPVATVGSRHCRHFHSHDRCSIDSFFLIRFSFIFIQFRLLNLSTKYVQRPIGHWFLICPLKCNHHARHGPSRHSRFPHGNPVQYLPPCLTCHSPLWQLLCFIICQKIWHHNLSILFAHRLLHLNFAHFLPCDHACRLHLYSKPAQSMCREHFNDNHFELLHFALFRQNKWRRCELILKWALN